jgi:hypothetical protein
LVTNNILLALLVRKRHQTLNPFILFLVFLHFGGRGVLWFIYDWQVSSSKENIMRVENGPINTSHEVS